MKLEVRYSVWRDRVRTSAQAPWQHQFYPLENENGPDGESLGVDVFTRAVDPQAPWVVHIAGTHGIEGYLGSDIQNEILQLNLAAARVNVILIHGLNSYGMAWYRRATRQNIDLNRNAIEHGSRKLPWPQAFRDLHFLDFSPRALGVFLQILSQLRKLGGLKGMTRLFGAGQSEYADALFYTGTRVAPEVTLLQTILAAQPLDKAQVIAILDVHTGLGNWAQETVFIDGHGPRDESTFWEKTGAPQPLSPEGEELQYASQGLLSLHVRRWLPKVQVYAAIEEFGAHSMPKTFLTLLRENRAFHENRRGDPKIATAMLEKFYPEEKNWREACRQKAVARFQARLKALSLTS